MSETSGSTTMMAQVASLSPLHQGRENEKSQRRRSDIDCLANCPQEPGTSYDTGKNAWSTVAGAWMIQFCTYGYCSFIHFFAGFFRTVLSYVSAFGVYQDYYSREFLSHETPSDISWIGSTQLFLQYAAGILVGRAFDAGFFHHMIALGTALQIISMFMLSLARKHHYYEVFLAQGLGMGLGQALLFLPSLTVIGQHFKRRRALAMGISVSGSSVGGIVWPILLNRLTQQTSFANSVRINAALNGAMLLASNFLMKTPPMYQNFITQKPSFGVIFKDSAYLVSVASAFCVNVGLFFPYFYLQMFALYLGIDRSLAFYSIAILNAGGFFGRILPNFFADRIGPYNMLLPCLIITSSLAFAMFGLLNFVGVAIFGLCYGFWSGSYAALIPSLLAQLSNHPGEHGIRIGTAFSIVGISVLIGTPIEGGLLRIRDGDLIWARAIVFCASVVLLGAVGMAISRFLFISQRRGGERGRWV